MSMDSKSERGDPVREGKKKELNQLLGLLLAELSSSTLADKKELGISPEIKKKLIEQIEGL